MVSLLLVGLAACWMDHKHPLQIDAIRNRIEASAHS
jgi:hypothetical protein